MATDFMSMATKLSNLGDKHLKPTFQAVGQVEKQPMVAAAAGDGRRRQFPS